MARASSLRLAVYVLELAQLFMPRRVVLPPDQPSVVELEEKRVAVELEVVGCDDMEGQKRSVVKVNPLRFQR